MHLLPDRKDSDIEFQSAQQMSVKLGGHVLAIGQMAAFAHTRGISLGQLVKLYEKSPKRMHRQEKNVWRLKGSAHTIDTVWKLSFDALGPGAFALLGVLSFVASESIPQQLFETDNNLWPKSLEFCDDDFT